MRIIDDRVEHRKAYPNWLDILAIVGIFVGASFVTGALLAVTSLFVTIEPELFGVVSYSLTFAITIASVIFLQRSRGARCNFVRFNLRKVDPVMILWGIVLVVISGVVIEPLLMLFPSEYLDFVNQAIGKGGWAILMSVILAPVLEEVLFRGLILEPLRQKSGAARAVLISALLFGVIHIIPQQVINAFVIGIILGYVYIRTGSLLNVIIIHALNNGLAYVQLEMLGNRAATTTLKGMIGNDTWYWVIYGIFLVLFAFSMYGMMRSLKRKAEAERLAMKAAEHPAETHIDNTFIK